MVVCLRLQGIFAVTERNTGIKRKINLIINGKVVRNIGADG